MNNWNSLKPESKLWIYGANREITKLDLEEINRTLDNFCETWGSHGSKLNCGYNVLYNRFICIAVDEESAAASGCSIDKSVGIVKQIDEKYNLDLFNRLRSYLVEDSGTTTITPISADHVTDAFVNELINEDSRMVNMQAATLQDLMPDFTIPLKKTWLKKYLNREASS